MKRSPFLDFVNDYTQKALEKTTCDHLIMVVGSDFDRRFREEMRAGSGKIVQKIDEYMGIAYEVRQDVLKDKMYVIDKRDWKPKIMVVKH